MLSHMVPVSSGCSAPTEVGLDPAWVLRSGVVMELDLYLLAEIIPNPGGMRAQPYCGGAGEEGGAGGAEQGAGGTATRLGDSSVSPHTEPGDPHCTGSCNGRRRRSSCWHFCWKSHVC